jgi:hypothetical protein
MYNYETKDEIHLEQSTDDGGNTAGGKTTIQYLLFVIVLHNSYETGLSHAAHEN